MTGNTTLAIAMTSHDGIPALFLLYRVRDIEKAWQRRQLFD